MKKFYTHTVRNKLDWKNLRAVEAMTANRSTADAIRSKQEESQNRRSKLADYIMKHNPGEFSRDQLTAKDVEDLERLAHGINPAGDDELHTENSNSPAVNAMTANRSTKQAILRKRRLS